MEVPALPEPVVDRPEFTHVTVAVRPPIWKRLLAQLFSAGREWLLAPLAGAVIGYVVIQPVVTGLTRPDSYKIYVVGRFEGATDPAAEVWNVLQAAQPGTLNDVPVSFQMENDHGDPAMAARIASNIAARSDTLMVIGHLGSTQTRAALPSYLRDANPPIPVILTTETNPTLLPPDLLDRFAPVFRLSPTDDQQAVAAARFLCERQARSIWVAESGDNPVYSRYLARQLVNSIGDQPGCKATVTMWSGTIDDQVIRAVAHFRIDWVFVIGGWENAAVVARQLHTLRPSGGVSILLSDSGINRKLSSAGLPVKPEIFALFPLPAAKFNERGYQVYGDDGLTVIQSLLAEANRNFNRYASADFRLQRTIHRLLGVKSTSDARNAIAHVMQMAEGRRGTFTPNLAGVRMAHFGDDGTVTQRAFRVWQLTPSGFVEPAEKPGALIPATPSS